MAQPPQSTQPTESIPARLLQIRPHTAFALGVQAYLPRKAFAFERLFERSFK